MPVILCKIVEALPHIEVREGFGHLGFDVHIACAGDTILRVRHEP